MIAGEMILASLALATSAVAPLSSPSESDDPPHALSPRSLSAIADACGIAPDKPFHLIDARDMGGADELSTYLETINHPHPIVFKASLKGEDVKALLGKLEGGCIYESDLSATLAPGADFSGSYLINSSIEGANWTGATLDGTRFVGVNAKEATLMGAQLRGAQWIGGYWNSNLEKTDFTGALMLGFRFECGITLDEFCGSGAGAIFDNADLSAADLAEFPVWGFDSFKQAFLENARVHPRALLTMKDVALGQTIVLASSAKWLRDVKGDVAGGHSDEDIHAVLSISEFLALRADAVVANLDRPSFDCAKAQSGAEAVICGEYNGHLRVLDREMADIYLAARRAGVTKSDLQRAWLEQRGTCEDDECITQSYDQRIGALLALLGPQLTLEPGETITFDQEVVKFSSSMRKSALYRRISPVLRSASWHTAKLTGLDDGGVRIVGDALGANAHVCNWEADVRFNPQTGWFEAQGENGTAVPMFRVWDGVLTPRFSGNFGNTDPVALEFITCGARASFGPMRALGGELERN